MGGSRPLPRPEPSLWSGGSLGAPAHPPTALGPQAPLFSPVRGGDGSCGPDTGTRTAHSRQAHGLGLPRMASLGRLGLGLRTSQVLPVTGLFPSLGGCVPRRGARNLWGSAGGQGLQEPGCLARSHLAFREEWWAVTEGCCDKTPLPGSPDSTELPAQHSGV